MPRRKKKGIKHSDNVFKPLPELSSQTSEAKQLPGLNPTQMAADNTAQQDANGNDPNLALGATGHIPGSGPKRKRDEDENDGWQTVNRKRAKKLPGSGSSTYPDLVFAPDKAKLNARIKIGELRDLIVYILADGHAPHWIAVKNRTQFRKVVAIYVPGLEEALFEEGVDLATFVSPSLRANSLPETTTNATITSPDEYFPRTLKKENLADELKPFAEMFREIWPVMAPGDAKGRLGSPVRTFMTTNLTKKEKERLKAEKIRKWQDIRTSVTHFLLTRRQMVDNFFLLHPAHFTDIERNFFFPKEGFFYTPVDTLEDHGIPEDQIEAGSITAGRAILAIDCEMVETVNSEGNTESSLARISIVDWDDVVIMDEFVKPEGEITNYLTQYSGITAEHLEDVTTTLSDIHKKLEEIITRRTILVGHSLEADLRAMRVHHPFVVDTSLLYPRTPQWTGKHKLKDLAFTHLNRAIQTAGADGHDSLEDARAALDLLKLKCQKGPSYGVPESTGKPLFLRVKESGFAKQTNTPTLGGRSRGKRTAIVDQRATMQEFGGDADIEVKCSTDQEIEDGIIWTTVGDPDGRLVSGGGVDFVYGRLHELEQSRQWKATADLLNWKTPELVDVQRKPCPSLPKQLKTVSERLKRIHTALPPCSALIVFSGQGNPIQRQFLFSKKEKCGRDEKELVDISKREVHWTEKDDDDFERAIQAARQGIGFVGVK